MPELSEQIPPQARREGIIVQRLPDEVLVYDLKRNRAHCLNRAAAVVWNHCDGKRTISEIAQRLRYELNADVDGDVVRYALDQLEKAHLLTRQTDEVRTSRRRVVEKLGKAAIVALPVVTSMLAPKASQAATCLPRGASCTTSAQCCSGICSAGVCA